MAYTSIDNPELFFDTVLWTGDGVNGRSLSGVLDFQPDWVWSKCRSHAVDHGLQDAVRGVGKVHHSNSTTAEGTDNWITALNSDGFTLSNSNEVNQDARTFIAWCWLGANGTASNSDGTISSTVSANTTSGFSIVSYTGNGSSSQTVGHGLGQTPAWIIVKNRDQSDKNTIFHQSLPNGANSYMELDQSGAGSSNLSLSPPMWGTPSSTIFGGLHFDSTNASGEKYIAYCFAEKQGYSKFGGYTGNGNADGTFVYTGFRPAFLILRRTDSGNNWHMADNKRLNPFNPTSAQMYPNLSNAEAAQDDLDILSNGFKLRQAHAFMNASSGTYIYMAFAENPFVNSKGVPVNAR